MLNDLRYALRMLRKAPGFTTVAVISLALGIGLCTTIFNAVNPLLFRPLPYLRSDELIYATASGRGFLGLNLSYADYQDWRVQNRVFTDLGAWKNAFGTIGASGEQFDPLRIEVTRVSASLFEVLGVQPILGRTFTATEDQVGASAVCIVSHPLWQNRFGGDQSIIGRSILLDGEPRTVIGVMPATFGFPNKADVWTPLVVPDAQAIRGSRSYTAVGRLKPGVTLERARIDLSRITGLLAKQYPGTNADVSPLVQPLREGFLGSNASMGWMVLGAVGFVLAVACANVANLFLARGMARQKEFAIRTAVGSSRWRIVRLLMVESLVLAVLGGILGFALSRWGLTLLLSQVVDPPPRYISFEPDPRILAFTISISLLTCLLFGLGPAWHTSGAITQERLKESGPGTGQSRGRGKLRSSLVVCEVALAVLLLSGAGLMIRTILNLQRTFPGFDPQRLAVCDLFLPGRGYETDAKRRNFFSTLLTRVAELPGVEQCSVVSSPPMAGYSNNFGFFVDGQDPPPAGQVPTANVRVVSPNYFATMRIPVLRGRDFRSADDSSGEKVVIIEQSFAEEFLDADTDPISKRIRLGDETWLTIVGVVGDVKQNGLAETQRAGIYLPHAQRTWSGMSLVVRTVDSDPLRIVPAIRHAVGEIDNRQPLEATTMTQVIQRSYWVRRLMGQIFGTLSLFGLVLAGVGIAAVVAYSVSQRTHEIGIRMAIGAQKSDIMKLVVQQGMTPVLIGLGVGLLASLTLTQVMSNLVYGVGVADPLSLIGSALLFTAVALLACGIPARRAARVDPIVALRAE